MSQEIEPAPKISIFAIPEVPTTIEDPNNPESGPRDVLGVPQVVIVPLGDSYEYVMTQRVKFLVDSSGRGAGP